MEAAKGRANLVHVSGTAATGLTTLGLLRSETPRRQTEPRRQGLARYRSPKSWRPAYAVRRMRREPATARRRKAGPDRVRAKCPRGSKAQSSLLSSAEPSGTFAEIDPGAARREPSCAGRRPLGAPDCAGQRRDPPEPVARLAFLALVA